MSNADDRCAFLLQSGAPCGVWRDTHPMIPFKPEFHHPFVEPAPRPAPSGDEEKVREITKKWTTAVYVLEQVPSGIHAAVLEAYAAGKADGAREEREACEKLGRDVENHYERQILVEQQSGAYQGEVVATAKREIGKRIADAIARRGSEGT